MNQREHIQSLIDQSKEQSVKIKKIQNYYIDYCNDNNDNVFSDLILQLDSYCISWVRKQLWKTGCYNDENEENIMQESRYAVWDSIINDKNSSQMRSDFAYYAFGIYKNKTLDIIRKFSKKRAKFGEELSMEAAISDDVNRTIEDSIKIDNDMSETEKKEKRYIYERIFYLYCDSFMNSNAYPPRSLALYYARILPHLLSVYHNITTIPDSKATSAKWAFNKMGENTVKKLETDAETYLQTEISRDLRWCEEFKRQLNEKVNVDNTELLLRDVVYTRLYDKGKIEDWADYMHKSTIKVSMKQIINDKDLLELVKEHVSEKNVIHNFMKGGISR